MNNSQIGTTISPSQRSKLCREARSSATKSPAVPLEEQSFLQFSIGKESTSALVCISRVSAGHRFRCWDATYITSLGVEPGFVPTKISHRDKKQSQQ